MCDPDYWKFSNEDGQLFPVNMREFNRDLDAAIVHQERLKSARFVARDESGYYASNYAHMDAATSFRNRHQPGLDLWYEVEARTFSICERMEIGDVFSVNN